MMIGSKSVVISFSLLWLAACETGVTSTQNVQVSGRADLITYSRAFTDTAPGGTNIFRSATARCPSGYTAVGGGWELAQGPHTNIYATISRNGPVRLLLEDGTAPDLPNAWIATIKGVDTFQPWEIVVNAICYRYNPRKLEVAIPDGLEIPVLTNQNN